MLDKILSLVRENAQDVVMNNPNIPEDKKEGVIQEAASSIMDGIKNETTGGGLQNILSSFTGGGGSGALNGIIDNIKGSFLQKLMGKLGLDSGLASTIASSLIPMVINKFFHKTADPDDNSFDIGSLLSSFTGGGAGDEGGIMGAVKGLF